MTKPYWIKYDWKEQSAITQELSVLAKGAYFCLMNACLNKGGFLADDDAKLANIVGIDVAQWAPIRRELDGVFVIDCRGWHNPDLLAALLDTKEKIEARRSAGRKGGRAKAMNGKEKQPSIAKVLLYQ